MHIGFDKINKDMQYIVIRLKKIREYFQFKIKNNNIRKRFIDLFAYIFKESIIELK